jgi:1-phosphatidylinositol phosphodiesterase
VEGAVHLVTSRLLAAAAAALLALASLHCGGSDGAGVADVAPLGAPEPPSSPPPAEAPAAADAGVGAEAGGHEASHDGGRPAYDAATWMGAIDDGTSLTSLSIPGTHDSAARHEPVPGTAKCQDLSIADQLAAGVRYLDLRCRHYGDACELHHGPVYQQLNLDDVLGAVWTFLHAHPTEALLVSVKEEYTPANDTRTFEQTFATYVNKNAAGWYLDATVPALGAVRGKLVLVRRFAATAAPLGLDATRWADDATFTIEGGMARFRIEDQYQVKDTSTKWTEIAAMLAEAQHGPASGTLYVSYTSGYLSRLLGVPDVPGVADAINPRLQTFFADTTHRGRFGVLAMDFVDAARASLVVATNFR